MHFGTAVLALLKTSSQSIGLTQSRDCRLRRLPRLWPYTKPFGTVGFISFRRLPRLWPYPKPFGTVGFISFRRLPRLWPYPKPFKQTRSVCLAFLLLATGLPFSLCSKRLPNPLALPKAGTVGCADFLGCGLTQSLSNKRNAFVWLF